MKNLLAFVSLFLGGFVTYLGIATAMRGIGVLAPHAAGGVAQVDQMEAIGWALVLAAVGAVPLARFGWKRFANLGSLAAPVLIALYVAWVLPQSTPETRGFILPLALSLLAMILGSLAVGIGLYQLTTRLQPRRLEASS